MLNDAKIKAAKPQGAPYKLTDSNQLYLYVSTAGGRSFRMNYTFGLNEKGKPAQKTLTFGTYPVMSLVDARKQRDAAKRLLAEGKDPAVEKKVEASANAVVMTNTFEMIGRRWHKLQLPRWSATHADDVMKKLERDVFPEIGAVPISILKAPRLLEVLNAIEERGAIETAHRTRQNMSAIFVYGIAAGVCESDPAASLGKALQPKPRVQSQPSIIDGFRALDQRVTAVRQLIIDSEAQRCRAVTKLALRLLLLTATRPGEVHGAAWDEFEDIDWTAGPHDSPDAVWRIPAARMKGDEDRKLETDGDHLVPLSWQAVEVLLVLRPLTGQLALCFPSERHVHKQMSENTLRDLLIRAGYYQRHVPHGCRAAFSTIMNERADREWRALGQPGASPDRAIIDLMLAHVPKDKVESAYNRAAFMPRRRELAQEWADLIFADMWSPAVHVGAPMRWASRALKPRKRS